MNYIIICLIVYAILFFRDLLPLFKEKKFKYLYFYIPVFAVTLVFNLMIGFGFQYVSVTKILENALSPFIKQIL